MATVQCSKCTAERKGFRRELDSWRHKLIHCVGFESILEGIFGPMLLRDLNLFDDCEPEEIDDWFPEAGCTQCSFCNLPLDKLGDQVPVSMSTLSSPSDYSPCQISESSQSAHKFLQAVFHKKEVPLGCDSNIPLVAQELMKKMIHQFAMEYASKCLVHSSANGVMTKTSSPLSEGSDSPLDLTVSRTQEEKECQSEPDGVLDLSNKNSASSATSSSSNDKATGSLLPSEELGDQGQRGTKCHQSSVLDAVLSSLCLAHRSLLYQILKLAHQEKMLSFPTCTPVGQSESHCCHCGVKPQDSVNPLAVRFGECKAHNNPYYLLHDCDHQGHGSTMYHSGDSNSNCSTHHYPLKDCKNEASVGSSYCCVQRFGMETVTVLCPKRLRCISCQSLAVDRVNNLMFSFASSSALSNPSSSLCPSSSICCNHHNPHSCPCYSNHTCPVQIRNTLERGFGGGDPPCPVLNREQSPSPPTLSPISSEMSKKTDEKPPSLFHHGQEEEVDHLAKNGLMHESHNKSDQDTDTEEKLHCRTPRSSQDEQNPGRTLLQDVVNRFSEKIETIRPLKKDPPLVSLVVDVSEKEQPQSPSTSQNLQCHADAHLTEIITKVLHKGSPSDYNISELFNRHDSKPKSPNTRSRRRKEVLAAITTPANDASIRRHSLKIKRELAMLEPPAKKAKLKDRNVTVTVSCRPLNILSSKRYRDEEKGEIQTATVLEDIQILKTEGKEREISSEEKDLTVSGTQIPFHKQQSKDGKEYLKGEDLQTQVLTAASAKQCGRSCEEVGWDIGLSNRNHEATPSGQNSESKFCKGKACCKAIGERQKCLSKHSRDEVRSRRNIVPPQRFSSYVTEPRKMFYAACFSESIFNQSTQREKVLTSNTLDALFKDQDPLDTRLESGNETHLFLPERTVKPAVQSTSKDQCGKSHRRSKDQCKVLSNTAADKKNSLTKPISDCSADGSNCAKPFGRLRSSSLRSNLKNSANMNVINKPATYAQSTPNSQVQYISPIKLMFVSPVKDEGGVRYSLKSAGSASNTQEDEPFDPCEASSWSGTPGIHKIQNKKSATSKVKSVSLPLKSATSPKRSSSSPAKSGSVPRKSDSSPTKSVTSTPKSSSSPRKSACSPAKSTTSTPKSSSPRRKSASSPASAAFSPSKSVSSSAKSVSSPSKCVSSPAKLASSTPKSSPSPRKSGSTSPKSAFSFKSASSSPKMGSRKIGEVTPTKRIPGTESRRSPCDLLSFPETTPPKRRPGRPKKLGPQLEQKVKRPIGRPRKQKEVDSVIGTKTVNEKSVVACDVEEKNKNLKITVVYGRSRRNKRMVSFGFDQLQTEFRDAWQAVGLKSELGILRPNSKTSSRGTEMAPTDSSEGLGFISPVKESAPQSSSNIKCQKQDNSVPMRKPGRPAKVKISGISVTVTTVSPRHREILINKDTHQSPETLIHKKLFLPEFKSAKEPGTISHHSTSRNGPTEKGIGTNDETNKLPNQPVAVRHSMRVRKPSVYFLHAVATSTSRSYSHSNTLLRRSKQLLLNKASNERRKEGQPGSVGNSGENRLYGHETNISQELSRVAGVSVDSIFARKETLRWWAASTEKRTMNQELARRIRLISDTWVSDTVENQEKEISFNSELGTKSNNSLAKKSKHSSVVRTLFDCSPNKPRSCSMQQLCSWFMQTTETQSLAIVKKASSRNPYELMHFPRSASKKSVCPSPQAERLRKHIKKFARTVPKSPLQHQQAQRRLKQKNNLPLSTHTVRRQLFTRRFATGRLKQGVQWWGSITFSKYQATLFRARIKFLTQKERERWQTKQRSKNSLKVATSCLNGHVVTVLQPKHKALCRPMKHKLSDCLDQTQEPVDVPKEQNICSKAWSPEKLKECRVFLRKINSPDNESNEEEWDSCTVTLDDGSPSAYLFAGRHRELVGVVKTVKTERKGSTNRRTASRELASLAPQSIQEHDEMPVRRQKGKYKGPGVVSSEPPPAKMLRQSRMRGLTGPRWCDFVFEN
ncbi:uncharacterized protein lcorl isoform X1 [Channa argus]|uniref:uncharacterized protein lcorl isoform X1 n=1 Tax=Channa argus TaxID=215402 RepID=UPI0029477D57|nr:hypothetical protein Q8A73_003350 [Channa argus]